MTYKTHFVGGICAVVLATSVLELPVVDTAVVTAVSGFSALIPDIDIEGSKANKALGMLGKGFASISHHRGFFHTPILYLILARLIYIFSPVLAIGFGIGTFSHLVLDTFNYKGIMWLWPLTKKHYHIARVKTRSVGENIFMVAMIAITVISYLHIRGTIGI